MTAADERRVRHMLDQIERIERYTAGGRAEFDGSELIQDAVMRCLSVIGEAASALTEETYKRLPSLPPYLPKSMRNRLVHEYWRVDQDIVWATIERELPPLKVEIEPILRS